MLTRLIANILMLVLTAVIGIVARELIPYLRAKQDEATTLLKETHWAWVAEIIDAVVRAVEQTVSEEIHGPEKKAIAVEKAKILCNKYGIKMTDEQLDTLIEAAVRAMNGES